MIIRLYLVIMRVTHFFFSFLFFFLFYFYRELVGPMDYVLWTYLLLLIFYTMKKGL